MSIVNGRKTKITAEIFTEQKALLEAAGLNLSEVVRISLTYYIERNKGALEQLAVAMATPGEIK